MARWRIVLKPPPGLIGGALGDAGYVEETIALDGVANPDDGGKTLLEVG